MNHRRSGATVTVDVTVRELAGLRALVRELAGIDRPNMADVKRLVRAAANCPRRPGCRNQHAEVRRVIINII